MTQRYIHQVIEHFSAELAQAEAKTMTLSLRAHLLHEAKRLQQTLKALMLQSELQHAEVLLLSTLDHFIGCARLERTDTLKTSCHFLRRELARLQPDRALTAVPVVPVKVAAPLSAAC